MATLLPVITARINHLKTCKRAGVGGESLQKTIDDTRTIILDHIAKLPKAIPVETASALINAVLEDNDLFGTEDRCAIVDSVNSKTCQHDVISDIPGARNDRVAADRTAPRQSMYNVENYFTQKIWH